MNRTEAYYACHEIMLSNPNHTAHQGEATTYLMVQIVDQGHGMAIGTYLIDPGVPEQGSINTFLKLNDAQQLAIAALPKVTNAVHRAHQDIEHSKEEAQREIRSEQPEIGRIKDMINDLMSGLSQVKGDDDAD